MGNSQIQKDLCLVALGAGLGIGSVYLLASKYSQYMKKEYGDLLPSQLGTKSEREEAPPVPAVKGDQVELCGSALEQDEIIAEQLTRNIQFFGLDGQKKITESFVVVVGLGGVGSHAAHMLLRAGVGRLRLVDFDQVSLSSLNRHCVAVREDVGTQKAACLEKYFTKIMPEAYLDCMCAMYCKETEEDILSGSPDYVIDAIDNIDTKVDLLGACHSRGLTVLSVMGAGAKADPTRIRFLDIAESTSDPLARSVRTRLKKAYNINTGISVLLSTERPRCGLVDSTGSDNVSDLLQYQIIPNFRIRTIPVLGTTPAIFGMAAAGYVLCDLAGQGIHTEPTFRFPEKAIITQYNRLEERLGRDPGVDVPEVEVLLREIWRGESARATTPRAPKALSKSIGNLCLTIWDPSKGDVVDNLILLTQEEADDHDKAVSQDGGFENLCKQEPEFADRVEAHLERARRDFKYCYYS